MTIVGFIVVLATVLGGYVLHHGKLAILMQPTEFLIIGGAAIGSLIISSGMPVIKQVIQMTIAAITGKGAISKADYTELLLLMYELTKQGKGNLLSLEAHVENPENSDIFKRYPKVLHNHHAVHFIADTLKVQISSPVSPYDLDDLMQIDMDAIHAEEHVAQAAVVRVSDAMPGLGIVAAVLGVVITMGKLTQGKEVIGQSVAGALVGTFIGILVSYGFLGPLAAKMESQIAEQGSYMAVIKAALLCFAKDGSPKVCVEFARRTIPPSVRPSFHEIDEATQGAGKKAA